MTQQWSLPAWAVLLPAVVGLVLLLAVLFLAARVRRADQRLAATGAAVDALRDALAAPEREPVTATAPPAREASGYVITRLGDEPPEVEERASASVSRPVDRSVVDAPLFADLVLRESVVQAASWAAGLRRAVAPETRHRVRLEMRRDVKRSRKQRRSDLRAARRDWEARQRAAADDTGLDEGSAA